MSAPVVGVMVTADLYAPDDLVAHVRRIESLGYESVWIPDMYGREIYVTAGYLLANTEHIRVASGIAHVYGRDAIASRQAALTLSQLYGGRFVQGLGVSHPIAAEMRGLSWEPPVDKLRSYLTAMRGPMPLHTVTSASDVPIYVAAHGPKMLAVAGELADGVNIYMQPPERMAVAREIIGTRPLLNVVLPCCLTIDADAARAAARRALSIYLPLPAYQRQWRASGFTDADWADGGSDRLVDAHVPWGDLDVLRERMDAYVAAGATGIVLAPLPPAGTSGTPWDLVEALAPG
jgi:probable F420-dependent oxidoreductase